MLQLKIFLMFWEVTKRENKYFFENKKKLKEYNLLIIWYTKIKI